MSQVKSTYNFVPAPEEHEVFKPEWANDVSHDIPFEDGESGEIEIELLQPDKWYEINEEMPDFGTVSVYNGGAGKFTPGFSEKKTEANTWLETL